MGENFLVAARRRKVGRPEPHSARSVQPRPPARFRPSRHRVAPGDAVVAVRRLPGGAGARRDRPLLAREARTQSEQLDRRVEQAEADLAHDIDRELELMTEALVVLSAAPQLATGDFRGFTSAPGPRSIRWDCSCSIALSRPRRPATREHARAVGHAPAAPAAARDRRRGADDAEAVLFRRDGGRGGAAAGGDADGAFPQLFAAY